MRQVRGAVAVGEGFAHRARSATSARRQRRLFLAASIGCGQRAVEPIAVPAPRRSRSPGRSRAAGRTPARRNRRSPTSAPGSGPRRDGGGSRSAHRESSAARWCRARTRRWPRRARARGVPRSVARSSDCLSAARSRSNEIAQRGRHHASSRSSCHGRRASCRSTSGNSVSRCVMVPSRSKMAMGMGARCYQCGLPRFATIAPRHWPHCSPTLRALDQRRGEHDVRTIQIHSAAAGQGAGDRLPDHRAAGAARPGGKPGGRTRRHAPDGGATRRRILGRRADHRRRAARDSGRNHARRHRTDGRRSRNATHRSRPQRALRAARHAQGGRRRGA